MSISHAFNHERQFDRLMSKNQKPLFRFDGTISAMTAQPEHSQCPLMEMDSTTSLSS